MTNSKRWVKICLALWVVLLGFGQLGSAQGPGAGNRALKSDSAKSDSARLPESIEGPALFKAYCASCHGTDGSGHGPMAEWLRNAPPDLRRISLRAGYKYPLARVQRIISGEEPVKAGHGNREMPVWGPVFSQVGRDRDFGHIRVYNLAKYIETMQQKE